MTEERGMGEIITDIHKTLLHLVSDKGYSPEECIFGLNHAYVSLFIAAGKYQFINFAEDPIGFEKRIMAHLQKCFNEAKEEVLKKEKEQQEKKNTEIAENN